MRNGNLTLINPSINPSCNHVSIRATINQTSTILQFFPTSNIMAYQIKRTFRNRNKYQTMHKIIPSKQKYVWGISIFLTNKTLTFVQPIWVIAISINPSFGDPFSQLSCMFCHNLTFIFKGLYKFLLLKFSINYSYRHWV